ncbi:hypothetical protein PLESTB_000362800 [Pleodorina starrii]|uniref:guanylate cyclase n=1 Tax=Pleodorina starrii TaxID=330485 RepID=A0A9W6BEU1_9CHLO|nr:hypothetical protein PLESTM_000032400 [Pleodorina starrii]GLC50287.1 hypothetical protein PLESTB_000362800 [Pleodorina starrii]GLC64329.1 hypothetical protein PLESTF_000149800 [Pleodorina starrii]
MIGWVNNAVESFVRDTFGDDVWSSVLKAAGVGTGGWVSSCPYPDVETYKIVMAAAGILGVTPTEALEAYGTYFVGYVTKQGYDKLLQTLGSNIAEFLQSLNNLHLHLTLSFPAMSAPAFKCTAVGPESLELHYYSHRPALGPIVVGMLHGLAERYWGLGGGQLSVRLLRGREDGSDDHEVFLLTYPYQEVLRDWQDEQAAAQRQRQLHPFTVAPDTFYAMFPFHILMDRHCCVVQAGAALTRLFPKLTAGAPLADTFQLRHPYGALEYDTIVSELNNAFLLKARASGLELKGQMLPVPLHPGFGSASGSASESGSGSGSGSDAAPSGCPHHAAATAGVSRASCEDGLLFMGTARLAGLDEMRDQRLFLSDIPLHDLNRDFVLLAEQRSAEAQLKERFEALTLELKQTNASLRETSQWLEEERRRSDSLLYQMLPPQVATCLKAGTKMPASEHPEATVLFSDIVGFTEIAGRCSPLEVCSLLDELYHHFDAAIEHYPELYKVETIGDAYMVVANVTTPCPNHADLLLEFAVRMHAAARAVRCSLGEHLRIRVGMHSGPVVAGVVGKKMPRFCLFGDTVNTASRMESHGLPGHIHISHACYACIKNKDSFVIRPRGNITIKGKGMMQTYLIAPAEQEASLSSASRPPARSCAHLADRSDLSFAALATAAAAAAAAAAASVSPAAMSYLGGPPRDAAAAADPGNLPSFCSVSDLVDVSFNGPEDRTSFVSISTIAGTSAGTITGSLAGLYSAAPDFEPLLSRCGGGSGSSSKVSPQGGMSRLSRSGGEAGAAAVVPGAGSGGEGGGGAAARAAGDGGGREDEGTRAD